MKGKNLNCLLIQDKCPKNNTLISELIGSRFRVQGLPAFGGAVGDQGSKDIND